MKLLPFFLLPLIVSFSLTHAEDDPKQRPDAAGPGREKIKEMILQKFDANNNGVLDPDEKAAAMKAMQERKGKSGRFPGAGGTSTEGGSKFRKPPEQSK